MTPEKARVLKFVESATTEQVLALLAVLSSRTKTPAESISSHSKGQYKRAIRLLRQAQPFVQDSQEIEDAVILIRRDWMGKEASV